MSEFLDWVKKGNTEVASFLPVSGSGSLKAVITNVPRLGSRFTSFILFNGKPVGGEVFDSSEEAKEWAENQLLSF